MINYLKETNYIYSLGNNCYLPNLLKLEIDRQISMKKTDDIVSFESTNFHVEFNSFELDWMLDNNHLKIEDIKDIEMIVYILFELKRIYKNYTKMKIRAVDSNIWMYKYCYQASTSQLLYSVSITKNKEYIDYYL